MFSDEATGVRVHLDGGQVLQWPISDSEGLRFEIPLAIFRVLTAEVEVEEDAPPRIPGDVRPKQKKTERRIVRTLEIVPWVAVKRLEYTFEAKEEPTAPSEPQVH